MFVWVQGPLKSSPGCQGHGFKVRLKAFGGFLPPSPRSLQGHGLSGREGNPSPTVEQSIGRRKTGRGRWEKVWRIFRGEIGLGGGKNTGGKYWAKI